MTQPPTSPPAPVLLEVEPEAWRDSLQRVRPWLAANLALQSSFRRSCELVAGGVAEPHVRAYLEDVAEAAGRHQDVARRLPDVFGAAPVPVTAPRLAGAALGVGRRVVGEVVGRAAGARGGTMRGLRVLMKGNLDAIGAFGVTQQLGLALGNQDVVDLVFPVLHEKQKHQLVLQEYLLETAARAVLYGQDT